MKRVTSFAFTGQLQVIEPPKYLEILHQGSRCRVKLAKVLRPSLVTLQPGQWLRVVGQQETKREVGEVQIRYKATDLLVLEDGETTLPSTLASAPGPAVPPEIMIKICTKGSCRKQGSLALLQELGHHAPEGVTVVPSGCLNNCKAGPTVCLGSQVLSRATPARVWGSLGFRCFQRMTALP